MTFGTFEPVSEEEARLIDELHKTEEELRTYKDSMFLCQRDMQNMPTDTNMTAVWIWLAITLFFAVMLAGYLLVGNGFGGAGLFIVTGGPVLLITSGVFLYLSFFKHLLMSSSNENMMQEAKDRGLINVVARKQEVTKNYNLITHKLNELNARKKELNEQLELIREKNER